MGYKFPQIIFNLLPLPSPLFTPPLKLSLNGIYTAGVSNSYLTYWFFRGSERDGFSRLLTPAQKQELVPNKNCLRP